MWECMSNFMPRPISTVQHVECFWSWRNTFRWLSMCIDSGKWRLVEIELQPCVDAHLPWYQGSWGQHGAHLGPTGPRWPHVLCYLVMILYEYATCYFTMKLVSTSIYNSLVIIWCVTRLIRWKNTWWTVTAMWYKKCLRWALSDSASWLPITCGHLYKSSLWWMVGRV